MDGLHGSPWGRPPVAAEIGLHVGTSTQVAKPKRDYELGVNYATILGMGTRLTPEDRERILRRYQEGAALRQIGREIGRPDITVRRALEAAGVEFGPPQTMNKRTPPEVEAKVVRLYDLGLTWAEIMRQTGVSDLTVAKILRRSGREFDRKPESAEPKAELMAALYEAGHTTRAIGTMLGHSKSTVNRLVAGTGAQLRPPRPAGCENPDFFDVVDEPVKAYWLGFLAADGCIITTSQYPEGSHLNVRLGIVDIGHLRKLKDTLGATASILTGVHDGFDSGKKHGYASLSVGSRRLTKALLALGIAPRKSATAVPWDGPADLMPHYWHGLFDGDGSLAIKTADQFTAFLCGSEPCVRGFTAWAHELCGTRATPYFRSGCWYVSIAGRHQVAKLTRAMYGDAPESLDRKQERADLILANAKA